MNAVDGLWPEEETASAGAGTESTSADDPFAPAEEQAEAADSGMGFFFAPADAEPEPEPAPAADNRRSHNRLSIRPAPRRAPARAKPRSAQSAVGKLARAVEGLRELESEMGATLDAADRALRALGGRDTYECAGFASYAELEQRLVQAAPFLQALRVAVRRSGAAPGASGRTEQHPRRTTKALMTISRALHRLRGLEDQVSQQALQARKALGDIETERLYEECGYTSFEDFLERALGPSPLLSCAVALVEEPPVEEETPPPLPAELPGETVGFDAPAMLWSDPEPEPEPSPPPRRSRQSLHAAFVGEPTSESAVLAEPPAPEGPPVEPSISPPPMHPRRSTHVVLTIVLALVATGIGAATARDGLLRISGLEEADASVLGQAASQHATATAAPSASSTAASSSVTAPSAAPAGRSAKPARPAIAPMPPRAAGEPAKAAPKAAAEPTSTSDATTDAITQAVNQAISAAKSPETPAAAKATVSRKRPSGR